MESTSLEPENFTGGTTNYTIIQPTDSNLLIFFDCIYIVTFIVGFIGNGLVIFLTGCRMKTTVNSIWFLNLAIADFILILTVLIRICFYYLHLYTSFVNKFTFLMLVISRFASTFFLVVISLDRCLCTWMAVWAQNNRTLVRGRIISMIVWVLSICSCIPFYIKRRKLPAMFRVTYTFVVSCLIPFLIIASSHIVIGVRIKRLKMGKKLRSYRGIIAVILTFFICCFPYFVCMFCLKMVNLSEVREVQIAAMFSLYLLFLNSCLNPILYVFMCDEYKKKLKQSLLLVLETAFAEDYLDFSVKTRTTLE